MLAGAIIWLGAFSALDVYESQQVTVPRR